MKNPNGHGEHVPPLAPTYPAKQKHDSDEFVPLSLVVENGKQLVQLSDPVMLL